MILRTLLVGFMKDRVRREKAIEYLKFEKEGYISVSYWCVKS